MKSKQFLRKALRIVLVLFLLLNIVAFFHAYSFTHFSDTPNVRTSQTPTLGQKLKILFTGINYPRPANRGLPALPFESITIQSNKKLSCWLIQKPQGKGTVVVFHGYGGEKSSMLDKAYIFWDFGFSVMLVDFMGSGGSDGNKTTIGHDEAEEVKDCFVYLQKSGHQNIHLFGTSMGAVAIMKAIADYGIRPAGIVLECPFGTMYETVCARFKMLGVPPFPMAGLLVFWGGLQNGFSAFSHNPDEYAKKVNCPTLLLYGEKDMKVSRAEIDRIFANLRGKKSIITFPLAGHENYLTKYKSTWKNEVGRFLNKH